MLVNGAWPPADDEVLALVLVSCSHPPWVSCRSAFAFRAPDRCRNARRAPLQRAHAGARDANRFIRRTESTVAASRRYRARAGCSALRRNPSMSFVRAAPHGELARPIRQPREGLARVSCISRTAGCSSSMWRTTSAARRSSSWRPPTRKGSSCCCRSAGASLSRSRSRLVLYVSSYPCGNKEFRHARAADGTPAHRGGGRRRRSQAPGFWAP
jgi:hypothetical protein